MRISDWSSDVCSSDLIGEEFGLLACIAIACVYLAILVRVFLKLLDEEDNFVIFAAAGLATQFGLQAILNIGVNTQILPSTGMTLPFISYGGSSMIALCIGIGLLARNSVVEGKGVSLSVNIGRSRIFKKKKKK